MQWAFVMVPISIVLSFLAAALLNQRLKGTVIFRTIFFLPSLTPVVAMARDHTMHASADVFNATCPGDGVSVQLRNANGDLVDGWVHVIIP